MAPPEAQHTVKEPITVAIARRNGARVAVRARHFHGRFSYCGLPTHHADIQLC
jgi:hypothetical protein